MERTPQGTLRFRQVAGHTWWEGGEVLRSYRLTVCLWFAKADARYPGFSLFLRQQCGWQRRSHCWVCLCTKVSELYMQKVDAGSLDPGFVELVHAETRNATPVGA